MQRACREASHFSLPVSTASLVVRTSRVCLFKRWKQDWLAFVLHAPPFLRPC